MAKKAPLLERLAELEHDQWVEWSKAIQRRVAPHWRKRWRKLWKPYEELTEDEKDKDRVWARKVMKIVKASAANKQASFAFRLGAMIASDGKNLPRG